MIHSGVDFGVATTRRGCFGVHYASTTQGEAGENEYQGDLVVTGDGSSWNSHILRLVRYFRKDLLFLGDDYDDIHIVSDVEDDLGVHRRSHLLTGCSYSGCTPRSVETLDRRQLGYSQCYVDVDKKPLGSSKKNSC